MEPGEEENQAGVKTPMDRRAEVESVGVRIKVEPEGSKNPMEPKGRRDKA